MKELKKNWLLLVIGVVLIIGGIFSISYFNKVNKGKTYLNKAENYINEVQLKDYLSLDTKTDYLQTAKTNIELSRQYFKSSKQNKLLNNINTIENELKKREIELAKIEVENEDKIKEINDILYKSYGNFAITENSIDKKQDSEVNIPQTQNLIDIKETFEYKLASINANKYININDPTILIFKNLLDSLEYKTKDTRQEISDKTVKTWQLLEENGIQNSLLYVMTQLNASIPNSASDMNYTEICAAWLTLTLYGK